MRSISIRSTRPSLTGPKRSASRLRELIHDGERLLVSSLVVYEWQRGPRTAEEIADQEALFPVADSVPFGSHEALVAADAYRKARRPRGREVEIAIAACAIVHGAHLWTMNPTDFKDIANLKLIA